MRLVKTFVEAGAQEAPSLGRPVLVLRTGYYDLPPIYPPTDLPPFYMQLGIHSKKIGLAAISSNPWHAIHTIE
jgi:hypothetical protein